MENTVKGSVEKKVDANGVTQINYSRKVSPGMVLGGIIISLIVGFFLTLAYHDGRGWSWPIYAVSVTLCFLVLKFYISSIVKIITALKLRPTNTIYVDSNGIRTSNNSIPYSQIDLIGTQQNPNSMCFVFVETNGKRVPITGVTEQAQAFKVQSLVVETANQHGYNFS